MPRPERLEGRDGAIWRGYLLGKTQGTLAEEFGLSHQRISQIIAAARADVVEPELGTAKAEFLEVQRALLQTAVELMEMPLPPAYSNGRMMRGEDGQPVLDTAGRLAAMDRVQKTQDRVIKVLGLEAPTKAEVTIDASAAAAEAAADALSYLHGGSASSDD